MEWSEGGEWDNCNSIINKYIKKKEKVMMENFPNLMREKVTQIQESQRVPIKRNPKRPTARHIIMKMAKFQDKERTLKAARGEKGSNIQGSPNKVSN